MGGGAWPFLVGGSTCLVYSVNGRDLGCWLIIQPTAEANFEGGRG